MVNGHRLRDAMRTVEESYAVEAAVPGGCLQKNKRIRVGMCAPVACVLPRRDDSARGLLGSCSRALAEPG